ncbi:MAG: hypothetical protein ACYC54_15420, partial [Sedimentisphaerales bacterium]
QWASGHLVSRLPAIQAKGLWLLPLRDCLSLNTPAFAGRTVCQDTNALSVKSRHDVFVQNFFMCRLDDLKKQLT